jgi:hypothetical protein
MPKVKISEYSATANSNTDVASINIDEGCAPSGINNAIRAVMGHLKDFQQGTNGDPFNGPVNGTVGATTPASGAFTTLSATGNVTLGDASTDTLNVGNGGLIKDSSGNLGLGVTPSSWGAGTSVIDLATSGNAGAVSASGTLSIANNGFFNGTDWIYKNTSSALLYQLISNQHRWSIAPSGTAGNAITFTQAMTLDASGNLGIGTTSPLVPLHVVTTGTGTTMGSNTVATFRSGASGRASTIQLSDGTTSNYVSSLSGSLGFGSAGTELMRLDSSGNLLVGTTSGSWHNLIKSSSGGYALNVFNTNASSGDGGMQLRAGTNNTASIVLNAGYQGPSATDTFRIYGNGTYGTISDATRKKNIESARDGYLQDLQQLRVVKYNWLTQEDEEAKELGFIAQEVEQVFAGLIETDSKGLKMIKQPVLIPMLVKAIQEQQAIITQLTARITALESA